MNIIIAEDVVTTGKSSAESAAALEALGAKVIAIACVVDRRDGGAEAIDGLPLIAAAKLAAASWDAADCPLCARGIPFVKPGSRK
jgi:orotate phosphoribosyltransferase